jgi:hypothetical protein
MHCILSISGQFAMCPKKLQSLACNRPIKLHREVLGHIQLVFFRLYVKGVSAYS